MRILLALACGMGVLSLSYTGWLFLFGQHRNIFFIPEAFSILSSVLVFFCLPKPKSKDNAPLWLHFTFYLFLVLNLSTFIFLYLQDPHGGWDSWAIWNMRARFLYRQGDDWQDAFSPLLDWALPDYPLLLPASVARLWSYGQSETTLIPFAVSLFFTFGTMGLLYFGLKEIKNKPHALIASLVWLGIPLFMTQGQTADIPLAFFILAAFLLLRTQGSSVLVGFVLGLACWTKNEGILFALTFLLARMIGSRSLREIPLFLLGMLPSLIILLYFKIHIAPASYLFENQTLSGILEKLMDPSRYILILEAFFKQFTNREWNWFPIILLIYPFLMGCKIERKDNPTLTTVLLAIGFMLLGYGLIYLLTPRDLQWHLDNSLNRLLLQLGPLFLFYYFQTVPLPHFLVSPTDKPAKIP